MIILPADATVIETQKWIHWMDAQCFPDAEGPGFGAGPVSFHGSHWFIAHPEAFAGMTPGGYAGWRPHLPGRPLHWREAYEEAPESDTGFLYRAGVLRAARGQGLQRRLIEAREESMRHYGIEFSVTYTDPLSIGSMRNLIACGYAPYEPEEDTYLCRRFEDVGHFVHWRKEL